MERLDHDCKYYFDNYKNAAAAAWSGYFLPQHLCSHPELVEPVNGSAVSAEEKRIFGCGKKGRFWKAK